MLSGDCTQHHTVKRLLPPEHPSLKVVVVVGTLTDFLMGRGHRREPGMNVCRRAALSMALSLLYLLPRLGLGSSVFCPFHPHPAPHSHISLFFPREPDARETCSRSGSHSSTPPLEKPSVDCLS